MAVIKTLFVVFLISWVQVEAQKCSSPQITTDEFTARTYINPDSINPRQVGDIKVFDVENVISITPSGSNLKYITAEYADGQLTIKTLDDFMNYEWEQTASRFTLQLHFVCTGESTTLLFSQNISAVNNFDPSFNAESYEILIPTPLPPGLDVTMFLLDSKIQAEDRDLYNYDLTFSIEGTNLFRVEATSESLPSKLHDVKLITTQQVTRLGDGVTFDLIATDSYTADPRSRRVSVTILSDPEIIMIDPPSFTKPIYKGTLFGNGTLELEQISITEATFDESVQFLLENDSEVVFDLNNDGPVVQLSVRSPISSEALRSKSLIFSIKASKETDVATFATVALEIVSVEQRPPVFAKSLYEGTFTELGRELALETIILDPETYTADVVFSFEGTHQSFFDFTQNLNLITVAVKESALTEEILASELLRFTVTATKEGVQSSATNVIV